jgi:hypothetical protein
LRASFILSPGLNSEAPFDMPVVRESFILSPGANSDAPRELVVFELCIWVPGAYCEAPLVDPAKLDDETVNIAAAATIRVFFITGLLFGVDPNVGGTKKFSAADGKLQWGRFRFGFLELTFLLTHKVFRGTTHARRPDRPLQKVAAQIQAVQEKAMQYPQ